MAALTFDTLKFVMRLEKAGVSREQASAMAEALRDASNEAEVATKRDIDRLDAKVDKAMWMLGLVLAGVVSLVMKQFF